MLLEYLYCHCCESLILGI